MTAASWITVCGEGAPDLCKKVEGRFQEKLSKGCFTEENVRYISSITLSAAQQSFSTTPKRLEMLRRLCQLYHVDLLTPSMTSHRPVIGPVIVACKKLLFRILRPLLEKSLRQQRDFNAATVYLLTDLVNSANVREKLE